MQLKVPNLSSGPHQSLWGANSGLVCHMFDTLRFTHPASFISPSVPDQHEDDACCDVQTADGTGDARLHIEDPAWISPTVALHVWLRDDNETGGSVGRGEFIFLSFYFFRPLVATL